MNAIEKFDRHFMKLNSYNKLMSNFTKYIFTFATVGVMTIFPYYFCEGDLIMNLNTFILFDMTLHMHLRPYLHITQDRISIPIYKLMRDTPIRREDFIRSRIKHLFNYLKKLIPACIAACLLGIFLLETPSLEDFLVITFFAVLLFAFSILEAVGTIFSATK